MRKNTLAIVASSLLLWAATGPASALEGSVTTSTGVVTHRGIISDANTDGWLLLCAPSHTLPDDPIAHPGQPGASHLHDFFSNASTNANSTFASMVDASNQAVGDTYLGQATGVGTSCDRGFFAQPGTAGDTGAYWAPVLYANGVQVIPTTDAELYYRSKPVFGTGFQPFPQDARLVVGNHEATSIADNPGLVSGNIYWECHGVTNVHYQLPPTNCSSTGTTEDILLNVTFPSCWDGRPMDHANNGNDNLHFAYPVNGACPAAFPNKVPTLSEKFKYTVPLGALLQLSGDPSMGMGLLPMYTEHADFWNTWDPASFQYLVDHCLNAEISCGTNPVAPPQVSH